MTKSADESSHQAPSVQRSRSLSASAASGKRASLISTPGQAVRKMISRQNSASHSVAMSGIGVVHLMDDGDGGLFNRYQAFTDPALEQLYQNYISVACLQFHKQICLIGGILTCLYGLLEMFTTSPFGDWKQGTMELLVTVAMPFCALLAYFIMAINATKSIAQNNVLITGIACFAWIFIGAIFKESLRVSHYMDEYQSAVSQNIGNDTALDELKRRPFEQLLVPNSFYLCTLHIFQADFFLSLPLRTCLAWSVPILQLIVMLILIPMELYPTSGVFLMFGLYMTCLCGATLAAVSNERFRRRNFYIAYRRLVKKRETLTAYGSAIPVHGSALPKRSLTLTRAQATIKSEVQFIPNNASPLPQPHSMNHSTLEQSLPSNVNPVTAPNPSQEEMIQIIANLLQGKMNGYGYPIPWPIHEKMSPFSRYLAQNIVNPIGHLLYKSFLLTSNDANLEQRARERGAIRAYRSAKSTFIILIISTLVTLTSVRLQNLYIGFRTEATVRHCVVLTFYTIGLCFVSIGRSRISHWLLLRSEEILTALFMFASMGLMTAHFSMGTAANHSDMLYFNQEVVVEYVVIMIAMSTVVSLRYFAFHCFVVFLFTLAALQVDPTTTDVFVITTCFIFPTPLIMANMSERQRRLNLFPADV